MPLPGQGQARAALLADQRPQQQRGQDRAEKLGHDVGRDALPREVAPRREGDAHRRVQVRAGDRPHEQDDGHHHQRRSHHLGAVRDRVAAEPGADHAAADGDQDQEEGAQNLREQPPRFVPVVPEVELTGNRVGLPHRPQGNGSMTDGILPLGLRFRGKLIWLAGHLTPLSGSPAHPADARASGIRPPPARQPLTPQSSRAPQSSSSDTDEIPSRATRSAALSSHSECRGPSGCTYPGAGLGRATTDRS